MQPTARLAASPHLCTSTHAISISPVLALHPLPAPVWHPRAPGVAVSTLRWCPRFGETPAVADSSSGGGSGDGGVVVAMMVLVVQLS